MTKNSISFPFQITVGRTNNLPIQPSNFKAIVYGKDGKQKAKYVGGTSNELKIDASLLDTNLANSAINKGTITLNSSLAEGEKLVFTYCPDLQYAEYSMNWVLARAAKKEENAASPASK